VNPDRPHFYLTTHEPGWLWAEAADVPLFVSHRRLARYKTLRPSTRGWALDSGGFTELSTFGEWRTPPAEYVRAVARYDAEIGLLEWAAPQDWMCEPDVINGGGPRNYPGTGLTVREHQVRTVENFLRLADLWPAESDEECPFMPVLQGWNLADYETCAGLYADAGVRLEEYPVVGMGSVCRRQSTGEIGAIVSAFTPRLALHGFGVKTLGLAAYGHRLESADSLAWSYDARRSDPLPGHAHKNCANCLDYALQWRSRLLAAVESAADRGHQLDLFAREAAPCGLCGAYDCFVCEAA
jgi:hypothetical protein